MKKVYMLITLLVGMLVFPTLTACSRENGHTSSSVEEAVYSYDVIMYTSGDYIIFRDLGDLASWATDIVRVEILDSRVEMIQTLLPPFSPDIDPNDWYRICTVHRLKILDVFKGSEEPGAIMEVMQLGGSLGRYTLINDSIIDFEIGDDMILFMESFDDGLPAVLLTPHQAVYNVITSTNGSIEVENFCEFNLLTLTMNDLERIADVYFGRPTRLELSRPNWVFPATGGRQGITVTTHPGIELETTIKYNTPAAQQNPPPNWLTVELTQPNQSGIGTVTIIAAPNQTFTARTATITVTAPNATPQTITIEQRGVQRYFYFNPLTWTPPSIESTVTVDIWSNSSWQAHSTAPWLTIYSTYPQNQTGQGHIILHAEPNPSSTPRRGQIILSAGELLFLLHVTQETTTPSFQLSQNGIPITQWNPTHLSESVNISVISNSPWEVYIPEHAQEWLSFDSVINQTGNGSFRLYTAKNYAEAAREAIITVATETETQDINVTQAAYQEISELWVAFHFDGTTIELPVINGYIDTSQVPTPATRYGQVGIPGQAHMGWFTEIFEGMHYVHNSNRAVPFNYSQAITLGMTDTQGRLNLYASWLQYGDVNGDGNVDAIDRAQLNDVLNGLIPVSHINVRSSDVNVDGMLNGIDRTLLQAHLLGVPGVILGPHSPNIATGSYLVSFNFASQVIDLPISNGGIDTSQISEAELLAWEIELLSLQYASGQRGGRSAGFTVHVTALDSASSYVMDLDLSAIGVVTADMLLEMHASYAEISVDIASNN